MIRLAGFSMDRSRGKAYLAECAERNLGLRATPAAVLLSMYHLDLEPDVPQAARLLVASLGRQPENVLLHWAGSLLAWRNTCLSQAVELTGKALWCCGEELGRQAIYLRYELGMFHFISMDWPEAHGHLRFVHDVVHSGKVFFPYRTLVTTQLAGVAFSMGRMEEGESLCRECASVQDWAGVLRLESDFAKVLQVFLKRRVSGRELLAFEVMYLLRQFPKVPPPLLVNIQEQLQRAVQPFTPVAQRLPAQPRATHSVAGAARFSSTAAKAQAAISVEHVSALVIRCVVLFYLGDAEQAMAFVPELARLCPLVPSWCTYLSAHGLYWCGRIFSICGRRDEALSCLRQALVYKKYPFNIGVKISKVLEELDQEPGHISEL